MRPGPHPPKRVLSGVSLAGVSLLSADVAATMVRPEVISQRVLSPEVEQGPIGKLSSRRTRLSNKNFSSKKHLGGSLSKEVEVLTLKLRLL